MQKDELRSVLVKHGHTYKDLAEILKISVASVINKANETNTEFKRSEIAKIIEAYGLTAEQVMLIFFSR